jgi:hypothetical protein
MGIEVKIFLIIREFVITAIEITTRFFFTVERKGSVREKRSEKGRKGGKGRGKLTLIPIP